MKKEHEHTSLEQWVRRISAQELPVLARTAAQVVKVAEDESVPAAQLTNIILHDAGMTTRVLRLANSAQYFAGQKLTTVSRALIVLGFNGIRALCLSLAVVDTFLSGKPREQLLRVMGRSFYAAQLAKALAEKKGEESPEEVFVAALLFHLGEMAFWSFGGNDAELLEEKLKDPKVNRLRAERELIGFHLTELTKGLAKEWGLGELLMGAVAKEGGAKARWRGIILAHEYATALERKASREEVRKIAQAMEVYGGLSREEMFEILKSNSDVSANTAKSYGALAVVSKIPRLIEENEKEAQILQAQKSPEPAGKHSTETPAKFFESDPALQLTILRELSLMINNRNTINSVLAAVLEGLYRGVGLDRAVYLHYSPERMSLKARLAIGFEADVLREKFEFTIKEKRPRPFSLSVEYREGAWVGGLGEGDLQGLNEEVKKILGNGTFFLAPAVLQGHVVGVFYADRQPSGRPLDRALYDAFVHFTQSANQGFVFISHA